MASTCQVGLTSLHRPAKTTSPTAAQSPARVLAWAMDYSDLLVTIPRNDKRTGQVSFSFDDPICQFLYADATDAVTGHQIQVSTAYEVMLFVRWRGTPVLWAPIVSLDWLGSDRKVTVNAVDVQRLVDHQLHHGDAAFEARHVAGNSGGIRSVIEAADMTTAQLDDGTPNHGINKPSAGTGSATANAMNIAVALDDPVWDKVTEIAGYEGAVDFSVIPRDVEDPTAYPYYADFTCYETQGTDKSDWVMFECGFGKDNAESMDWSPGGTYLTHAIVRDSDNKHRVIEPNLDARRRTGAYVHVENTPSASPSGTMTQRALSLVKQYSFPVDSHAIVVREDDPKLQALADVSDLIYLHSPDDFDLGDTISCEVHDGYYHKRVKGQVNEVRVRQDGQVIKDEFDLVPELVDVTEIGDDGVY
jgi:hypothetical protein